MLRFARATIPACALLTTLAITHVHTAGNDAFCGGDLGVAQQFFITTESYLPSILPLYQNSQEKLAAQTLRRTRRRIDQTYPFNSWRHLTVWDQLPVVWKRPALEYLIEYEQMVLDDVCVWESMSAEDWQSVHPPGRVVAFMNMVQYWYDHYDRGETEPQQRAHEIETLRSMLVAESYTDHLARSEQDIGLFQHNKETRDKLRAWHTARQHGVDFYFDDEDYWNPYHSVRAGVFWFRHLVRHDAKSNLQQAIRAYNSGIRDARRGSDEALEYERVIERRRCKYLTREEPNDTALYMILAFAKEAELLYE